jgi:hypothetical protein
MELLNIRITVQAAIHIFLEKVFYTWHCIRKYLYFIYTIQPCQTGWCRETRGRCSEVLSYDFYYQLDFSALTALISNFFRELV